jgi:nitroreductase
MNLLCQAATIATGSSPIRRRFCVTTLVGQSTRRQRTLSSLDISVTDHLLTTTRAVRKRLDLGRPVERSVILDCLRIAVQAPTASNSQTWRWVVVTDAGKRAELARIYREGGADYLRSAAGSAMDDQTRRVYESALHLTEILAEVPVHVIPCLIGRADNAPNILSASMYASVIPAAWSFMLALRSRGLGSAWTTLHLFKEQEAAELLGIPADVTQVSLIPVAYTTGGDFKPAKRPPVEQITYWDSWNDISPES